MTCLGLPKVTVMCSHMNCITSRVGRSTLCTLATETMRCTHLWLPPDESPLMCVAPAPSARW